MRNPWKVLMKNVEMSAEYGAAGARELKNPPNNNYNMRFKRIVENTKW